MADPTFGISITRVNNEPLPVVGADMAVVGLVGTAPAANATTFPLNTPVLLFSDDADKLAALGDEGTLPDAVRGINDQLGEFQAAARVVVVRVEEGIDVDATMANIIGSEATRTGIYALLTAGPILGVVPRLVATPGFTSQQKRGVTKITIVSEGTGYEVGDAISGTGGGGSGFAAEVSEVDEDGKIVAVAITDPGSGYSSAPTLSVSSTGGTGASLTATIEKLANPVIAALPSVLNRLLAHAVVDGPATTLQDWVDWRETISSDRIIPVETAVKYGVSAAVKPASPRIIGIGVRRDHEFNGRPFHSWANQPVAGIVGPNRPIDFSLTDGSTEGQTILSQNGGIIVRGEMGVENAIASGGFVYIGTDTCSEDPLWQFYNVTRGRDYIHLMFLRTLRNFLGKRNIDVGTITDILNTMRFALRNLEADGDILPGWRVFFTRDQNTPEDLRLGRFTVDFAVEEPPVLRYLGLRSQRNRASLELLVKNLENQISTAA